MKRVSQVLIVSAILGGLAVALYTFLCLCAVDETVRQTPTAQQVSAWSYTVNGQSFDYATQCWTENGVLLCDAEDGTRLKVDSYTPMYWERQE